MNLKKYLRPIFFEHDLYIGIDLGLTDFLTFSNGKVIQKPDLKRINGRIRYYQQKLSRQKEGGSNWKKTLRKLHKWINKKNNVINDYYHKISYNIVKHCKIHCNGDFKHSWNDQIQFEPKHSRNRMGKTHRNDTIQSTMVRSSIRTNQSMVPIQQKMQCLR